MTITLKDSIIAYLQNQQLLEETIYINPSLMTQNEEKIYIQQTNIEQQDTEEIQISKEEQIDNEMNKGNGLVPEWEKSPNLDELYNSIHNCKQCHLGDTRTNFVFGSGNHKADIMIIGEAPGKDEDEQGLPFVGKAGQLLTKIIESINLSREDVYIANICKCRPPGNRAPLRDEVSSCIPFLLKQIELIQPAFIVALGATAVASLTGEKPIMAEARGILTEFHKVPMLITYHPAALLYNPNLKKFVWEDMKLLRKLYEDYLNNKN